MSIYMCIYVSKPEKAMASHSSTLAWRIPWAEEAGRLQSMGSGRVGHDWATSLSHIGEGNCNPLQCSCLENPRDGGAWWAAVYGVAQNRTRLKRLSSSSSMSPDRRVYMSNSVSFCQHLFLFLHSSHCSLSLPSCAWWTPMDCLTPPGDFEFSESRNCVHFTHIVGIPPIIVKWTHRHKQGRQWCWGIRQSVSLGPVGSLTGPIFLFLSHRHVSSFSVSLSLGPCESFKPAKATSERRGRTFRVLWQQGGVPRTGRWQQGAVAPWE